MFKFVFLKPFCWRTELHFFPKDWKAMYVLKHCLFVTSGGLVIVGQARSEMTMSAETRTGQGQAVMPERPQEQAVGETA